MKEEIYRLTYELEESHWWYIARRKIIMAQIENILSVKANKDKHRLRILDYGCGTGFNIIYLSKIGAVYGIDLSPTAIQFCRTRGIENVMQISEESFSENSNPFGQPFDLVIMLDVLEHIPNEASALKRISQFLKPEGILLVTAPAYEFLRSGEDFVSHHLRRYTRTSLNKTLRNAGYEIIKSTYFNFFLFPLQAAFIVVKKVFFPQLVHESNLVRLPKILNTVLSGIMSSEAYIVRKCNVPIGGSIFCCCRNACTKQNT